jgi:hypothetical protein
MNRPEHMSAAQHKVEAERLDWQSKGAADHAGRMELIARAQVHATLATITRVDADMAALGRALTAALSAGEKLTIERHGNGKTAAYIQRDYDRAVAAGGSLAETIEQATNRLSTGEPPPWRGKNTAWRESSHEGRDAS